MPSQLCTKGWALAMVTDSLSTATARILWRWAKAKDINGVMAATSIFSGSMRR
ncbi:hypothetical protein D3C81_2189800 [compost metagenome]